MAEVNNQSPEDPQPQQHSPLPTKRKPDVECLDPIEDPKRQKVTEEAKEEEPAEEEEEEDDDDEEEEEEDDEEEEEVVVDRKGKGIMKEDPKGKGKMVAEDDDSDSDLSERVNNGSDDEASDLSDDPLAEVDLDNILPSRTRRRVPPPPGAYEVNDLDDDDDDDDDSDVDA